MSDTASWADRTVPLAGIRQQAAASVAIEALNGPELVVNHGDPGADPFAGQGEYVAVISVRGHSAHDACFIDDDGVPHFKPWAYYLGAEAHPAHRGITLLWPGCRVEVTGEDLQSVYPLVMTRRAGVWRVFDAARHDPPKPGMPVIHSIRVVIEDSQAKA